MKNDDLTKSWPQRLHGDRRNRSRALRGCQTKWRGRRLTEILEQERTIDFYEQDNTTASYLIEFGLLGEIKRERLFVNNNQALVQLFTGGIGFAPWQNLWPARYACWRID